MIRTAAALLRAPAMGAALLRAPAMGAVLLLAPAMGAALLRAPAMGAVLLLAPPPAGADGLDLTPSQRAAFGAEIRALLLDEPEIVARALQAPDPYAAEIASDLDLIARHRAALFDPDAGTVIGAASGPVTLTVFTKTPEATRAALAPLTQGRPALRILIRPPDPALLEALGLDITPAHVLPDRMIRGDVPAALIARYLD